MAKIVNKIVGTNMLRRGGIDMRRIRAKYPMHLAIALLLLFGLAVGCAGPAPEAPAPEAPPPDEEEPSPAAPEQEVININLGTLWGGGHVQSLADLFVAWTEEASAGRLEFTVMPGGTAVPVEEHLDAIGAGVFDLNYMYEGYYYKEIPAFQVLTGIPGMLRNPADAYRLCELAGFNELRDRMYAELNMAHVGCRSIAGDAIVSTVPLEHTSDLEGIKIRSEGLDAEAFAELGASTVFTPQDEVYTALSSGLLDAAETGNAISQYDTGFHEIAKYWVQPDLQSCGTGLNMAANKDFWDSLDAADKALIERTFLFACEVMNHDQAYRVGAVLNEVQSQYGVTVHYWGDEDLKNWGNAIMAVLEMHEEDPDWAEAWQILQDYRKVMGYA